MAAGRMTALGGLLAAATLVAAGLAAPVASSTANPPARAVASAPDACPWVHQHASAASRAREVLRRMSPADKVAMIAIDSTYDGYQNALGGLPALCVPRFILQDGPAGVCCFSNVTQLPAPIAVAATFDRGIARRYGDTIGAEDVRKGIDVCQGPDVDLTRVPQWGRSFETFGEDPYLTSELATSEIRGVHTQHVLSMVKHFTAYNQERHRYSLNVQVRDRPLHELYLAPFRAAIRRGRADSVMCAVGQISGREACSSPMVSSTLRRTWRFDGMVRTDYKAVEPGQVNSALRAGTDVIKMPPSQIQPLVDRGAIRMKWVDRAAMRVLVLMFASGLFDRQKLGSPATPATSSAHAAFARLVAERSAVLLKNRHVLPLRRPASMAVVGPACSHPITAGAGSAYVTPPNVSSPLEAIRRRAGRSVTVTNAAGTDLSPAAVTDAASLAAHSDIAIVCVGTQQSEEHDMASLALPSEQNHLIRQVSAANPHTVVLVMSGNPVLMPWLDRVAAVLDLWYCGQECGNALAALLFGSADPAGHLPLSFPRRDADTPTHPVSRYPGIHDTVHYTEGLRIGYRWYQSRHIRELFPFGFGLSYTNFRLSQLAVRPLGHGAARVAMTMTNTGKRAGRTVAQVYVRDPRAAAEPAIRLQAFTSLALAPRSSRRVGFRLSRGAFTYWNRRWRLPPGWARIYAGTSSRQVQLSGAFDPRTGAARRVH